MISLGGRIIAIHDTSKALRGSVLKVLSGSASPDVDARKVAYRVGVQPPPPGFGAYLYIGDRGQFSTTSNLVEPAVTLSKEFDYLSDGDLIALSPNSDRIRVLFRQQSPHNSFLVTERCDNYCLMCSQPPKDIDDDWVVDEILEALPMVDRSTVALGFTGGEPTLVGERFIRILDACKHYLPTTAIHVLSNGRKFADRSFTRAWAGVQLTDLMVGIPVYSDVSTVHDYVVQADGAYDETIRGILNLKELKQQVEIRVVIHQQTFSRLPQLAEFVARNLLFVDHVALMGLEIMGFTRANLDALWIDPINYQRELRQAVDILAGSGLRVSIYNHQLCLLDRALWPYAKKSISDWKNDYLPECTSCSVRQQCGGFFSSAKYRRSEHIHPL